MPGVLRSMGNAIGGMYWVASPCPDWMAARMVFESGMTRQITRSTCGDGFLKIGGPQS